MKESGKCQWTPRRGHRTCKTLCLTSMSSYLPESKPVYQMTALNSSSLCHQSLGTCTVCPQMEWPWSHRWKLCTDPIPWFPVTKADATSTTADCSACQQQRQTPESFEDTSQALDGKLTVSHPFHPWGNSDSPWN